MAETPEAQGHSFPAHVLDLVPGQAYPVSAHYHGLLYPGEAIVADGWEPQLGLALEGERLFRVVFLTSHQAVPPEELQDARIAVCVPSRSGERREQERKREHRILREVRSRYGVPEPDPALLQQERGTYASGTIVTRTGVQTQPRAHFEAPLPVDWVSSVAESLLAWTYPQLPIESSDFPGPFTNHEARLLFKGLVQEEATPEVAAAVVVFAPGLGLTTSQAPGVFAPGESMMFQLLRQELAESGGSLRCSYLYERMVHVHGLLHPLVTLCVLAFLRYGQPQVELHLAPGHTLRTVSGERYSGRVVVQETVASLDFPGSLERAATSLRYATPVSWNTLALYFSSLDPSIQPVEELESQEEIPRLLAALTTLRREVVETQAGLQGIAQSLGGQIPEEAVDLLDRLRRLTEARAAEPALRAAQRLFGPPIGMTQAMERYQSLHLLATLEESLAHIHAYLKEAHVPEALGDLLLLRQQVAAVLQVRELVSSTPSRAALEMLITSFMDAYRAAYIHQHESYHQEVASLRARLEEARPEAQGLERLNGIRELGEPVEDGAPEQWRQLSARLAVCQVPSGEIPLGQHPTCQDCGIRLGQESPSQEVEAALRRLRMGLREQNRRISTQVVHRILEGAQDEHIDQFIKVVQASDLTGLANVLDDRLVSFLRVLLAQS